MPGGENVQQITDSYASQAQFQGGVSISDILSPAAWSRTRTPFISTWREVPVANELNWGSTFFGIDVPESLRILQSAYLRFSYRVEQPAQEPATRQMSGRFAVSVKS